MVKNNNLNHNAKLFKISILCFVGALLTTLTYPSFHNLLMGLLISIPILIIILMWYPPIWLSITILVINIVMFLNVDVTVLVVIKFAIFSLLLLVLAFKTVMNFSTYKSISKSPIDFFMFIFFLWGIFELCYGIYNGHAGKDILISVWAIQQIPIYYFITKLTLVDEKSMKINLYLLTIMAIVMALFSLTADDRLVVGSAAIGGYISHIVIVPLIILIISKGKLKAKLIYAVLIILFLSDIIIGGSRRFIVPVLASLFMLILFHKNRTKIIISLISCSILALLLFDIIQPGGKGLDFVLYQMTRGEGYRGAERLVAYREVFNNYPIIGAGFGQRYEAMLVGTKGVIRPGPTFHSYYATLLVNMGLIGTILFLLLPLVTTIHVIKSLKEKANYIGAIHKNLVLAFLGFYIGWVFTAQFDAPRDGHWLIGLLPALIVSVLNFGENRNKSSEDILLNKERLE